MDFMEGDDLNELLPSNNDTSSDSKAIETNISADNIVEKSSSNSLKRSKGNHDGVLTARKGNEMLDNSVPEKTSSSTKKSKSYVRLLKFVGILSLY